MTKLTWADGGYHHIEMVWSDGQYGPVRVDGKIVREEALRRFMLGDAVVDAELIPKRLWKDK